MSVVCYQYQTLERVFHLIYKNHWKKEMKVFLSNFMLFQNWIKLSFEYLIKLPELFIILGENLSKTSKSFAIIR